MQASLLLGFNYMLVAVPHLHLPHGLQLALLLIAHADAQGRTSMQRNIECAEVHNAQGYT
eukprot:1161837-Pelagomonas_calceolata.AAC.5